MMVGQFRELADTLGAEIEQLAPGTRITSEHDIARRFGISRATARATLEELRRRQLVRRLQGVGTFRARRIDYRFSRERTPSWSRTVRDAGAEPHAVVQSCELVRTPPDVAARLGIDVDSRCFELRRRSFADGLPAAWGSEWVPRDVVPELPVAVRIEESLHTILRDMAQVEPRRASSVASMDVACPEVARELDLRTGDLVWMIESVNTDAASGRPLCFTRRWIRADAIRVVFELGDGASSSSSDWG